MKLISYHSIITGGIRVDTGNDFGMGIFPIKIEVINKVSNKRQ